MQDAAAPRAEVRRDDVPLDPRWSAPADIDEPPTPLAAADRPPAAETRSRRRSVVWLIGVVVVALLAVGLWRGGAFGQRTDRGWPTPVGATVSTGPFELAFNRVSVQHKKDYNDSRYWEVVVSGSGRTTGDESIAPRLDDDNGMFVVRDTASSLFAPGETMSIGQEDGAKAFTPGLRPVPIAVTFKLADSWKQSPSLLLVVYEQELRDNSLLKNQNPEWRNATHAYVTRFDVTRLPDDLD